MSKMLTIDISDSDKSKRMINFLNNHICNQSNSYNNFYNSQIIKEEIKALIP